MGEGFCIVLMIAGGLVDDSAGGVSNAEMGSDTADAGPAGSGLGAFFAFPIPFVCRSRMIPTRIPVPTRTRATAPTEVMSQVDAPRVALGAVCQCCAPTNEELACGTAIALPQTGQATTVPAR